MRPWSTPPSHGFADSISSTDSTSSVGSAGEPAVLRGIRDYQRHTADLLQPVLAALVAGQHPQTLFLCCADSRLVPNLVTGSGPGDLFTVRNIGNLVPLPGTDLSVAAALEYGVGHLAVPTVVVCGHSGCGAMHALFASGSGGSGASALGGWLGLAGPVLARWRAGGPVAAAAADRDEIDQLAMVNVVVQLEHLRSHPVVAAAEAAGRTRLIGLFFDLPSARMLVLDEATGRFDPMSEGPVDVAGMPAP